MDRERKRALQHAPFRQVLSDGDMNRVKACLPFSLTEDQEAAVGDILAKMTEGYPMNHLLLGDVGTGKTVVAAFALVCAALSGHQAMLMGPTEVLVSQYGISLGPILDACDVLGQPSWGKPHVKKRKQLLPGLPVGISRFCSALMLCYKITLLHMIARLCALTNSNVLALSNARH